MLILHISNQQKIKVMTNWSITQRSYAKYNARGLFMNPLMNAGIFLVKIFFDLYIIIFILRILLQLSKITPFTPISQFIIKLTNWPLSFLRMIPKVWHIDLPAIIFSLLLEIIKIVLITFITGLNLHFSGIFIWAFASLFIQILNVYFMLILLIVIISWFISEKNTQIFYILSKLTDPLLSKIRKLIHPIHGIDISPIIAIIILQLIIILIGTPLLQIGMRLTFG